MRPVRQRATALLLSAVTLAGAAGLIGAAAGTASAARPATAHTAAARRRPVAKPVVVRLWLSRAVLPATGGVTVVHLKVRRATTCWLTAAPAVRMVRAHRSCARGADAVVARVAANRSTRGRALVIVVHVHGGTTTVTRRVVVRQKGRRAAPTKVSPANPATPTGPAAPAGMAVATGPLPVGSVGVVYDAVLSASGGTAPYQWALTAGVLPAGVTLSANGLLYGTPTVSGPFPLTVTATDATGKTASANLTLQVGSGSLQVTSTLAPFATQGVPYSLLLTATGGSAPYHWSISSGVLPSGVALSSTGVLAGTPTTIGTFPVTLVVTDASQPAQSATFTLTLSVVASANISVVAPSTLPQATVGSIYGFTFQVSGGTAPYSWQELGGTVPPGLILTGNGALSGTPTKAGTYVFSVQVKDSSTSTQVAQATVTLTVQ